MSILKLLHKLKKNIKAGIDFIFTVHRIHHVYDKAAKDLLALNPQPELSQEDIKAIDSFWGQYGIKFKDYSWFRWYFGVSGLKDPRFMPKSIYKLLFLPRFNNEALTEAYKDKCFFDHCLPNCPFPKTIFKKINGRYYDSRGNYLTEEEVLSLAITEKEVILKPNDEKQGNGVKKYTLNSSIDLRKLLEENIEKPGYIVQAVIKQHPFFAQFNESSVNIMRIYTLYINGRVEVMDNAVIRFGVPGQITDVCYENGKEIVRCLQLDKEGNLLPRAVDMNGFWTEVPDLFKLSSFKVPGWEKVLATVKEGALSLPYFAFIGWDVTVNEAGEPVVVEYNINYPGEVIYQYRNPLLGSCTEEFLAFLKNTENQKKYILLPLRK